MSKRDVYTYQDRFFVEVVDHIKATDTHKIWDQIYKSTDGTWARNSDGSLRVIARVVRDIAHIEKTDMQA